MRADDRAWPVVYRPRKGGMTPLAALLIRRIAETGPITLADYMAECLFHPTHGYYITREPFGAQGDFTTAPEISQMFGELLGLCLAQAWLDQGSPAPFTLAELGPGRGTLMADVLRATRGVPGFHAGVQVRLVEASPRLRYLQKKALAAYQVTWADDLAGLPPQPLFLLANEFFDALPVRQFTRQGQAWAETMVGVAGGALTFGRSIPAPLGLLAHRLADTADGEIVELCPAALPIFATMGQHIAARGGAGLIVDYGGWQSRGDTFQAVRNHAFTNALAEPGLADLTAHVDFAALAAAANPARTAFVTQGAFLTALGIQTRAAALAQRLQGEALEAHHKALHRLTAPDQMGQLFKVLALSPPHHPPLPGTA
jgi:NADH dehydrogenase [ubiquinone] 1 alpha subcomplex assembly factor 7